MAEPTRTSKSGSHRIGAGVLVALGTLAAFLAVVALWVNRQVMDTDNWTDASSQMLQDKAIRTALSGYLVDQLYANVDVAGEIRAALPPQAKPIAPAAAGALRNVAEDVTNRLLQRPRVQSLWEAANRAAHTTFLKIVDGGGPAVSTANGVVKLDLAGVLQQLADRVGASGNLVAKIPPGAAELTVLRSNQLKTAQDVARVLRALPIVLLALVLLLYGGAIALARERRRETVRAVGFGFVVAGALALVARSVGGDALVNSLGTTETVRPAIAAVFRIDTELLVEAATAAIAYGIVLIVGGWPPGHPPGGGG